MSTDGVEGNGFICVDAPVLPTVDVLRTVGSGSGIRRAVLFLVQKNGRGLGDKCNRVGQPVCRN